MIELRPGLFVGGDADHAEVTAAGHEDWYIISASKEPHHRRALGYATRAAPRDDPEYLIAKRRGHLILNLVDAADPAYIPAEIINTAIEGIDAALNRNRRVLVHCNEGKSRAPTIALLYLRRYDPAYANLTHAEGVELFMKTYPSYSPGKGMATYAEENW